MRLRSVLAGPGPNLLRLAAWVWTGIVFLLCVWPADELPQADIPLIDKWTHLVLFGGFNFLWLLAAARPKQYRRIFFITGIAVLYGGLLELIQSSVPALGRSGDWADAIADALGALLAALFYMLIRRS